MKKYDVIVKRESGWWILTVPKLNNITSHSKTLSQVENVSRELISAWLDASPKSFKINISIETPIQVKKLLTLANKSEQLAKSSQEQATETRRQAVKALLDLGLSTREAAQVIGVSHQRISQLAN